MTIGRRCLAIVALFMCALLLGMAAAQEPQTPTRIRVSQGVSQALLIQRVPPQYPEAARSARISGIVVLQAIIDKDGAVQSLKVVQGHPLLIGAAMDAVKQWRYKPYYLNGQPIEVDTLITVNFTLAAGSTSELPRSNTPPGAQEQDAAPKTPWRVQIPESLAELLVIKHSMPEYSQLAQLARIQGYVILKTVVNAEGKVVNVRLVSGHPMLWPAAADAVKQSRFRPLKQVPQIEEMERRAGAVKPDAELAEVEFQTIAQFDGYSGTIISPMPIVPADKRYKHAEITPGVLIHRIPPRWPDDVDLKTEPAWAVVELKVDTTGAVTEVRPVAGSSKLFAAAGDACKQWRYVPGFVNGEPVATVHHAMVTFTRPQIETRSVP